MKMFSRFKYYGLVDYLVPGHFMYAVLICVLTFFVFAIQYFAATITADFDQVVWERQCSVVAEDPFTLYNDGEVEVKFNCGGEKVVIDNTNIIRYIENLQQGNDSLVCTKKVNRYNTSEFKCK